MNALAGKHLIKKYEELLTEWGKSLYVSRDGHAWEKFDGYHVNPNDFEIGKVIFKPAGAFDLVAHHKDTNGYYCLIKEKPDEMNTKEEI
ncbi:hypothetical protein D3C71_1994780 [compost metagenome]